LLYQTGFDLARKWNPRKSIESKPADEVAATPVPRRFFE
jgi:hypothetical protein